MKELKLYKLVQSKSIEETEWQEEHFYVTIGLYEIGDFMCSLEEILGENGINYGYDCTNAKLSSDGLTIDLKALIGHNFDNFNEIFEKEE